MKRIALLFSLFLFSCLNQYTEVRIRQLIDIDRPVVDQLAISKSILEDIYPLVDATDGPLLSHYLQLKRTHNDLVKEIKLQIQSIKNVYYQDYERQLSELVNQVRQLQKDIGFQGKSKNPFEIIIAFSDILNKVKSLESKIIAEHYGNIFEDQFSVKNR